MASWTRSTWTDAGHLLSAMDPDAETNGAAGQPLDHWFSKLVEADEPVQALQFLAHAMPRYECVTWAARAMIDSGLASRSDPLMVAILRWIDEPDDAMRRAVGLATNAIRKETPLKMLGHAVFFSGGSIAPDDLPPVLPQPDICAKFAAGAILLGALSLPGGTAALKTALSLGEATLTG